jgi:hypothetical protein
MRADVAATEDAYRAARDQADRAAIAVARGIDDDADPVEWAAAIAIFRALITKASEHSEAAANRVDQVTSQVPDRSIHRDGESHEAADDHRALATMRSWLAQLDGDDSADADADAGPGRTVESAYATAQANVDVGDSTITRLGVLERLSTEPDPARRKALFTALTPVWRTIDGDGTPSGSPYQREILPASVRRWRAGRSPLDANARALGLDPVAVEPSLRSILEAWRSTVDQAIEPWDQWYAAGAANRALNAAIPLSSIRPINDAYHAALGADPAALNVGFDVFPRAGRPPVPVAYTDFGGRPATGKGGSRMPAKAWVMATYTTGGLGELTELMHETGHAIHVSAINTRPAFADWPDSDALTEAIAELTALDTAEPTWQERWLGTSIGTDVSIRGRYADVMLDICWALLEILLHADPSRRPNDVWAELTSTYLGLVPHPELSWWAMRGQLVQEPGYMLNYAIGPMLAADMRSSIRSVRGDWTHGDHGWYSWISERIYRFGLERSSRDVLSTVLGRAPSTDALIAEIRRGG